MPIKTPSFWYKTKSWQGALLLPLAWLYQLGHRLFQTFQKPAYTSSIPVICIGNAIAGGGGKTPTVIALLNLLKKHDVVKNPIILTRGYGRKKDDLIILNDDKARSDSVGDEALLLACHAPVIICADRAKSAQEVEKMGADLIIMDDGFFNQSLTKTLTFLVIDRLIDFGNGWTLPAGPLREPLSKILPKTDAVITIGRGFAVSDLPVFEAALSVTNKPDKTQKYIAFCGLAIPEKFHHTLQKEGYDIIDFYAYPDHHAYSEKECAALLEKAKEKKAKLITTEKDWVRLPPALQEKVAVLPITLHFQDEEKLVSFIQNHV